MHQRLAQVLDKLPAQSTPGVPNAPLHYDLYQMSRQPGATGSTASTPPELLVSPLEVAKRAAQHSNDPREIAQSVLSHHQKLITLGGQASGRERWVGRMRADSDTQDVLKELQHAAAKEVLLQQLPDPRQRAEFLSAMQQNGMDPAHMLPRYQPVFEALRSLGKDPAFQSPAEHSYLGKVKVGNTVLSHYSLRKDADGMQEVELQYGDGKTDYLSVKDATEQEVQSEAQKSRTEAERWRESAQKAREMSSGPYVAAMGQGAGVAALAAIQRAQLAEQKARQAEERATLLSGKNGRQILVHERIENELRKPEWEGKIGQYGGWTEFLKGLNKASLNAGTLVARIRGDEDSIKQFAEAVQLLEEAYPGSTRRGLVGGFWNEAVKGAQQGLGQSAPYLLGGWAAGGAAAYRAPAQWALQQAGRVGVAGAGDLVNTVGGAYMDVQQRIQAAEAAGDPAHAEELRQGRDAYVVALGLTSLAIQRLSPLQKVFPGGSRGLVGAVKDIGLQAAEAPLNGVIDRGVLQPGFLNEHPDVTGPMAQEIATGTLSAAGYKLAQGGMNLVTRPGEAGPLHTTAAPPPQAESQVPPTQPNSKPIPDTAEAHTAPLFNTIPSFLRLANESKSTTLSQDESGATATYSAHENRDPGRALARLRESSSRQRPAGSGEAGRTTHEARSDSSIYRLQQLSAEALRAGLAPLQRKSGEEHEVRFDPDSSSVIKLTNPGEFGAEKLGLQGYLQRLAWTNELFDDRINVEGTVHLPGEHAERVVTTQPWYRTDETRPQPTQPEIDAYMRSKGFLKAFDGAYLHESRDIAASDALPKNFIRDAEGHVHPVDVILVEPSASRQEKLQNQVYNQQQLPAPEKASEVRPPAESPAPAPNTLRTPEYRRERSAQFSDQLLKVLNEDSPGGAFAKQVASDWDGFVRSYKERQQKLGKAVTHIDPDEMAFLFPEFADHPERRADLQDALRKPSGMIADLMFQEAIEDLPRGSNVVLNAGGPGVGKSVAAAKDTTVSADLTLDGTLQNTKRAIDRIDRALSKGHKAAIRFVHQHPGQALHQSIERARKDFRTVPAVDVVNTNTEARKSLLLLAKYYENDPNIRVFVMDNSRSSAILTPEEFSLAAYRPIPPTEAIRLAADYINKNAPELPENAKQRILRSH